MNIKFNKHYVTDGVIKVKCTYSAFRTNKGQDVVRLYAKDYRNNLRSIFFEEYEDNTDLRSDYFETGQVTLYPNHPLYAAALERCQLNEDALKVRIANRILTHKE